MQKKTILMIVAGLVAMMLVCLAVAALLIFGLGLKAESIALRAQNETARVQLEKISAELALYQVSRSGLPERLEDLVGASGGGHLKAEGLLDPWGETFVYEVRGKEGFELISKGADKIKGTDDDISAQ